ncbi:hypothetical protein JW813_11255 [Clostridium botulinum]|uniref:hypothetical protein n=1 Tax=Clostridium botulinum TaxID=1491 RepID=UPI002247600A|nr:hypothetical protein [Clostridium botulinum]UZP02297.1 hypothetical protein JW813_11255 [Clostridium botulinum]UZP05656.1 hypothetical protein JYA71_11525 [Clostridium botulinum]UZP09036.1 hypothetical protein JYA74_11250 [Clostridium botulinum]
MSVDEFKPTLWEGALIANFHSVSIAEAMSTKPTDIKGKTVKFNKVNAGNLKDYEGVVNWDDIDTTDVDMTFDKKKYFAIKLDDCDKVQTKADVMVATTAEHSAVLAETYDKDFFITLTAGAKASNVIGSKSSKIKLTKANVYDYIVDLGTKLAKNKVPKINKFVTVDAEVLGLLSKDKRFTSNPNVLSNGFVEGQKINGMQVMSSEELPTGQIVAHHLSAAGCAKQLDEMEAMRLQNAFADGIRGLCMYGSKVLREEAIAVLNYEVGTDTDIDPINVNVTNTVNTKTVTE